MLSTVNGYYEQTWIPVKGTSSTSVQFITWMTELHCKALLQGEGDSIKK